jgi:hypothetical protein
MHPFHNQVQDGLPSLLLHYTGRNDDVVIRAQSPFAVSGALHGLDDEKAEVFEPSLQFSSMVV